MRTACNFECFKEKRILLYNTPDQGMSIGDTTLMNMKHGRSQGHIPNLKGLKKRQKMSGQVNVGHRYRMKRAEGTQPVSMCLSGGYEIRMRNNWETKMKTCFVCHLVIDEYSYIADAGINCSGCNLLNLSLRNTKNYKF